MYKKGAGKKSISRNYQNINCSGSEAGCNYKSKVVNWGSIEGYTLGKKLGEGTFSEVFKGVHKKSEANVAIKRIMKGNPGKIKREVSILKRIKGSKNNAHIFDSVKGNSGSEKYIVINYYVDDRLIKNNTPISEAEVKEYMFQLLNGLDEAHSRGVIHRDIKPANIVINRKRSRLKIIDWGMADFYHHL
ncbi:protein kinase [Oceanimonas sp. CHS3-5]|uniref:protein kinase domain-containing protein n=1 Tax=Oceanimonas sp. CHS3-5 TaxID=3068186 RepID=UPI00273DA469|nr:protein kinase [Oceanimonas sp. CHS3-5]MDP5292468.1 protein kinase [Oceanimonas sp. CHS3-5]